MFFYAPQLFAQDGANIKSGNSQSDVIDAVNQAVSIKNSDVNSKNITKDASGLPNSSNQQKPSISLMYSDEEIDDIKHAINGSVVVKNDDKDQDKAGPKESEERVDNSGSYIYLNSILYNSSDSWSVWINGKKISSTNNDPKNEIYIKSVTENSAEIVWKMSVGKWRILSDNKSSDVNAPVNAKNQVEFGFTLNFNQSYNLAKGEVTEGKIGVSAQSVNNQANKVDKLNSDPLAPRQSSDSSFDINNKSTIDSIDKDVANLLSKH